MNTMMKNTTTKTIGALALSGLCLLSVPAAALQGEVRSAGVERHPKGSTPEPMTVLLTITTGVALMLLRYRFAKGKLGSHELSPESTKTTNPL
ncbi:MAG: hypothetical protein CMJ87_13050 [Planctomycetes bacterium]|jgi:hypothetical protein|nr:hypothetical protein [Planctomycetota bacterium]